MNASHSYDFYSKLARIVDTGKSRSVMLTGNIYDVFYDGKDFVPLVNFLSQKCAKEPSDERRGINVVLYEINHPVRFIGDKDELERAWNEFKGKAPDEQDSFSNLVRVSSDNITLSLEFLRQLAACSRKMRMKRDLLIIIEGADMLVPVGAFSNLNLADRKRIAIFRDWFCDPEFLNAHDSVLLLAESRSQVNEMVSNLPQITTVAVPSPNSEDRKLFADWYFETTKRPKPADCFYSQSAGLSILAYRQLLCDGEQLSIVNVIDGVEDFVSKQLGEDVVEYSRPTHKFQDLVGFTDLKSKLQTEVIPRFQGSPDQCLPGAAVAGPIGSGKTFIMEAMAAELKMPVLVLKNLRSQWFGQTDVIFERLRRTLEALDKVVIFLDEADTQFGGVGKDTHETERRLTGRLQAMMSDSRLRGKVFWLLMTARIHMLSPDIRRPGRVGDLIIPILDPVGDDRKQFLDWALEPAGITAYGCNQIGELDIESYTKKYSAASYAALRSRIKAMNKPTPNEVREVIADFIPPDIEDTRQYQTFQALLNCTRRSFIPRDYIQPHDTIDKAREYWRKQVKEMELNGIE